MTLGAQMKQMHNLRIVAANIMGEQALTHSAHDASFCVASAVANNLS